ncbi:hypothetical protein DIPPA_07800 [Diplonema papillatum]|nr:hypothetical protein DIPPA_07800 [Diplonema papillatum]
MHAICRWKALLHRQPESTATEEQQDARCDGANEGGDTAEEGSSTMLNNVRLIGRLEQRSRAARFRVATAQKDAALAQGADKRADTVFLKGDEELYSKENFAKRYRLRKTPAIHAEIEHWWAQVSERGKMTYPAYVAVFKPLYFRLVAQGTDNRAQEAVDKDWINDSGGSDYLNGDQFFYSVFGLADLWCNSCEAGEYVEFLRELRVMSAANYAVYKANLPKPPVGKPKRASKQPNQWRAMRLADRKEALVASARRRRKDAAASEEHRRACEYRERFEVRGLLDDEPACGPWATRQQQGGGAGFKPFSAAFPGIPPTLGPAGTALDRSGNLAAMGFVQSASPYLVRQFEHQPRPNTTHPSYTSASHVHTSLYPPSSLPYPTSPRHRFLRSPLPSPPGTRIQPKRASPPHARPPSRGGVLPIADAPSAQPDLALSPIDPGNTPKLAAQFINASSNRAVYDPLVPRYRPGTIPGSRGGSGDPARLASLKVDARGIAGAFCHDSDGTEPGCPPGADWGRAGAVSDRALLQAGLTVCSQPDIDGDGGKTGCGSEPLDYESLSDAQLRSASRESSSGGVRTKPAHHQNGAAALRSGPSHTPHRELSVMSRQPEPAAADHQPSIEAAFGCPALGVMQNNSWGRSAPALNGPQSDWGRQLHAGVHDTSTALFPLKNAVVLPRTSPRHLTHEATKQLGVSPVHVAPQPTLAACIADTGGEPVATQRTKRLISLARKRSASPDHATPTTTTPLSPFPDGVARAPMLYGASSVNTAMHSPHKNPKLDPSNRALGMSSRMMPIEQCLMAVLASSAHHGANPLREWVMLLVEKQLSITEWCDAVGLESREFLRWVCEQIREPAGGGGAEHRRSGCDKAEPEQDHTILAEQDSQEPGKGPEGGPSVEGTAAPEAWRGRTAAGNGRAAKQTEGHAGQRGNRRPGTVGEPENGKGRYIAEEEKSPKGTGRLREQSDRADGEPRRIAPGWAVEMRLDGDGPAGHGAAARAAGARGAAGKRGARSRVKLVDPPNGECDDADAAGYPSSRLYHAVIGAYVSRAHARFSGESGDLKADWRRKATREGLASKQFSARHAIDEADFRRWLASNAQNDAFRSIEDTVRHYISATPPLVQRWKDRALQTGVSAARFAQDHGLSLGKLVGWLVNGTVSDQNVLTAAWDFVLPAANPPSAGVAKDKGDKAALADSLDNKLAKRAVQTVEQVILYKEPDVPVAANSLRDIFEKLSHRSDELLHECGQPIGAGA